MQTVKADGYPVLFGEKEYDTLNAFIEKNNYSILFLLVDSHTNEWRLLRFFECIFIDMINGIKTRFQQITQSIMPKPTWSEN